MSTETVDTTKPGVVNEYPDIVGAKPDNPYLASFHPYIPPEAKIPSLPLCL